MKSLADALDGAVPWLQQFRMRPSEIAPSNDVGLLFRAQFVRFVANQFSPVLLKPYCQTLPFLRSQLKNRVFELFQAHATQFTVNDSTLQRLPELLLTRESFRS